MVTMMAADPFDLSRFVAAQDLVFDTAVAELKAGRKETHWMWFVFPQLRALGRSPTASFYGIGSIEEARAYLEHPVLRDRSTKAVDAVLGVSGHSAHIPLARRSQIPLVDDAVQRNGGRRRGGLPARAGSLLRW